MKKGDPGPSARPRRARPRWAVAWAALLAACGGPAGEGPWERQDLAPAERAGLSVSVTDPSGAPVSAWVVLVPGGRDAAADADGVARFDDLSAGDYEVTARAAGFLSPPPQGVVVPVAGEASAAVQLVPEPATARIDVTALSTAWLAPLADAPVLVDGADAGSTGADGTLRLDVTAGPHTLTVAPPAGTSMRPWTTALDLAAGAAAAVAAELPGAAPDGAAFLRSGICERCHSPEVGRWAASAHGRARSNVARLEIDGPPGLLAAFDAGASVSLDPAVPGASIQLSRPQAGVWMVEVLDGAGGTSGLLPVIEGYGGQLSALALAVGDADDRKLLPAGWSLGADAPTSLDPAPGWVPAWTEAWFDAQGHLRAAGPTTAASFDLACSGCHATGYALDEASGTFQLVAAADAAAVERAVGCEACHGPAGEHPASEGALRPQRVLNPARLPASEAPAPCSGCHQRLAPDAHPFSADPGYPVDDRGEAVPPWRPAADAAVPDPDTFEGLSASRVRGDQVRELESSPHRAGWAGDCTACHDPHGSAQPASLRFPSGDNDLCTTCHRARFPNTAAEVEHSGHATFAPGSGGPGACVACHLPRAGLVLRRDAISGVGESHAHVLQPWTPDDVLAIFDAAGTDTLPIEQVPVTGCLDCHLRTQAALADVGGACDCPAGDPTLRATWEAQAADFAAWQGASR